MPIVNVSEGQEMKSQGFLDKDGVVIDAEAW
jgi:hypothetical protein